MIASCNYACQQDDLFANEDYYHISCPVTSPTNLSQSRFGVWQSVWVWQELDKGNFMIKRIMIFGSFNLKDIDIV